MLLKESWFCLFVCFVSEDPALLKGHLCSSASAAGVVRMDIKPIGKVCISALAAPKSL